MVYSTHAILYPTILIQSFTLLPDCRYSIYILLSPRQKHNTLSHETQYKTILIQNLIFFPHANIVLYTLLSPYNTIHYYLHVKILPYYPQARLYPIFPIQIFTLLPQLLPYYTLGKTITCDPHAILDPTILFPIFTLLPTCRL